MRKCTRAPGWRRDMGCRLNRRGGVMLKRWVKGTFGAVVLAGCTLGVAMAAESTLKIAYETSDTHIKARTAKVFKEELEKLSKGRIEVQVFPNASLMPSRQEV